MCLYLGEVTASLDFPIEVDPEHGRAQGWFLKEDRTFALDLARKEVTIAGKPALFDANRLQRHPNGICVELTLLSAWFPIEFKLDMLNAIIDLKSWEPLPVEQRLARERLRAGLRRGGQQMSDYPPIELPYRMWDWPVIDVFLDSRLSKDGDGEESRFSGAYDLLAVGDVLRLNGELYISGDDNDSLTNLRARFGRKNPEGGMLGRLNAREFTLGDVSTPQTALVAKSEVGGGVEVSSFRSTSRTNSTASPCAASCRPAGKSSYTETGSFLIFVYRVTMDGTNSMMCLCCSGATSCDWSFMAPRARFARRRRKSSPDPNW